MTRIYADRPQPCSQVIHRPCGVLNLPLSTGQNFGRPKSALNSARSRGGTASGRRPGGQNPDSSRRLLHRVGFGLTRSERRCRKSSPIEEVIRGQRSFCRETQPPAAPPPPAESPPPHQGAHLRQEG